MTASHLKGELDSKSRDELNIIARKLRIGGYRKLNKPQLIDALLAIGDGKLRKALRVTWWSKNHNHVYGLVSVVSLLLAVVGFLPRRSPDPSPATSLVDTESLPASSPIVSKPTSASEYVKETSAIAVLDQMGSVSVFDRESWKERAEMLFVERWIPESGWKGRLVSTSRVDIEQWEVTIEEKEGPLSIDEARIRASVGGSMLDTVEEGDLVIVNGRIVGIPDNRTITVADATMKEQEVGFAAAIWKKIARTPLLWPLFGWCLVLMLMGIAAISPRLISSVRPHWERRIAVPVAFFLAYKRRSRLIPENTAAEVFGTLGEVYVESVWVQRAAELYAGKWLQDDGWVGKVYMAPERMGGGWRVTVFEEGTRGIRPATMIVLQTWDDSAGNLREEDTVLVTGRISRISPHSIEVSPARCVKHDRASAG